MANPSFTKEDRAVIIAARDSGKTWPETATEASKKLGRILTAESARFQYRQGKTGAVSKKKTKKKKGHSLEEFRSEFDIAKKIRDKVAELIADSSEEYWTDDEFRQICGVSVQNWRRHAELDEFKRYQFRKPGFHAWAPPSIVEAMKEITGHAGH